MSHRITTSSSTTSATNLTKDRRSIFFRGNHLQRHFLGRIYEHQTFPKISEDASWRGWRAPRRVTGWRGCTRASLRFSTRHTTTRTDRSALQVRLRALSVPSDRNRSPRGASAGLLPWNERPGRCGRGAQAVGRDPSGHQRPVGAIGEPRSARPMDTSSTSRGPLRGRGRAWLGGNGLT